MDGTAVTEKDSASLLGKPEISYGGTTFEIVIDSPQPLVSRRPDDDRRDADDECYENDHRLVVD